MAPHLRLLRYRLLAVLTGLTALGSGAAADPPAPAPPPVRQPAPPQSANADRPGTTAPDEDFIEFLGADDVGDAAWWEFLKKSGSEPGNAGGSQDGKP